MFCSVSCSCVGFTLRALAELLPDCQLLVDNNADWWEIWEVVLPVSVEQESSILCPALYSSNELIGDTDIIGFCAASEKKTSKKLHSVICLDDL